MEHISKKPKVVFEQYVIAHYHIPFLAKLAEVTDLIVVVSEDKKVDGLLEVKENLPFKCIRLKEGGKGELFHPDIFKIFEEQGTEIYFSITSCMDPLLSSTKSYKKMREMGIKTIWLGCDGYMVRNFYLNLIFSLLDPRKTIRTIQGIIAKRRTDFFMPYSIQTVDFLHKSQLVPKEKMSIVHNAIDTEKISLHGDTNEIRRDPNKIIFTGRLTSRKKADLLIKALANLTVDLPNLTLDIIGDGSEFAKLQTLVSKSGLQNRVRLIEGIYEDENLAPYLWNASLFVMPGLGGLGFNSAMAANLPIIYTHADGTEKELFKHGVNGYFFDGSLEDLVKKIRLAFSNKDQLESMGKLNGEILKTQFSIENMVKGYIHAIEQVSR